MNTTKQDKCKAAGIGISADFKPARQHRVIKFADDEVIRKAASRSAKEFSTAFAILAK